MAKPCIIQKEYINVVRNRSIVDIISSTVRNLQRKQDGVRFLIPHYSMIFVAGVAGFEMTTRSI